MANCPRCGSPTCNDPDSKACSDHCITRHIAREVDLEAQVAQLAREKADLAFQWGEWEKEAHRQEAQVAALTEALREVVEFGRDDWGTPEAVAWEAKARALLSSPGTPKGAQVMADDQLAAIEDRLRRDPAEYVEANDFHCHAHDDVAFLLAQVAQLARERDEARTLGVLTLDQIFSPSAPFEYDQGDVVTTHYDDLYNLKLRADQLPRADERAAEQQAKIEQAHRDIDVMIRQVDESREETKSAYARGWLAGREAAAQKVSAMFGNGGYVGGHGLEPNPEGPWLRRIEAVAAICALLPPGAEEGQ